MLPPPTTTPTCTPLRTTSPICRAMSATIPGSMPSLAPPDSPAPANASPESLSRTRFHCRDVWVTALPPPGGSSVSREIATEATFSGTDFEPGEALERDTRLVQHLLDG